MRGLVPRWGGGGRGIIHRANSPYRTTTPAFHTLVCRRQPASAIAKKACPGPRSGIDSRPSFRHWYENDVTRPRVCLNATAPALVVPAPQFVIPAKAGIHALTSRERTSTAIPPPTSTRRPHFVFPAIARPVPRYAAGIQRGGEWQNPPCQFAVPSHNSSFPYLGVPAPYPDTGRESTH